MSVDSRKLTIAHYWMRKARESLASSRSEKDAGRIEFSINRSYYAAFYAASAVLIAKDLKFSKHSGVRAAVHRDLVNQGVIAPTAGQFYDTVFEARQVGDYGETSSIDAEEADTLLRQAEQFVEIMEKLLPTHTDPDSSRKG